MFYLRKSLSKCSALPSSAKQLNTGGGRPFVHFNKLSRVHASGDIVRCAVSLVYEFVLSAIQFSIIEVINLNFR